MNSLDPIFDISKKVIVLTGASGLVGTSLLETLLERGAYVHALDINIDTLTKSDLNSKYDQLHLHTCDVSCVSDVRKAISDIRVLSNQIDVLINNHQYKPEGFLEAVPETFPDELWTSILEVNLTGTFYMCREVGSLMLERGKGSIINLASTYGVVSSNPSLYTDNSLGNPLAYSVSKAGVIMLTKYLGTHWASRGVRVNAVTPHGIWNNHEPEFVKRFSRLSPMNRLMQPSEINGAILYLASDASSYSTGSNLLVEGGWTSW